MENQPTQTQIIDGNGNFKAAFEQRLKQTDMANFGQDYHIVSIIGNQSTGKSTLLNKLFGTQFDVMNASLERKRTTEGIFISKDYQKNILILDVEGADSNERAGKNESFQNRIALFSLVLSKVLMVNMFTQEAGRFTGSNSGILKVIFENNLKLFKQEGSKKLVFIFRDCHSEENKQTLEQNLRKGLYKIWDEIPKPQGSESSRLDDCFQLEFVFLDHFLYARESFITQVSAFRQRFVDPETNDYFFKHTDISSNVPIDGLCYSMQNIWTTIESCKEINLPSHRILVADFRCTKIKDDIINALTERIKTLKEVSANEYNESFGLEGGKIKDYACKSYDHDTQYYDEAVVEKKRRELIDTIFRNLQAVFDVQVSILQRKAINDFDARKKNLNVDAQNLKSFEKNIIALQAEIIDKFERAAETIMIPDLKWNIKGPASEVKERIQGAIFWFKLSKLPHILREKRELTEKSIETKAEEFFGNLVDHGITKNFWAVVEDTYNNTLTQIENEIQIFINNSIFIGKKMSGK